MRALFLALLLRDLRLAARRRIDALLPLVFFMVVISLFPLGVGTEAQMLRTIAPGVVWACALLATMLSAPHSYAGDPVGGFKQLERRYLRHLQIERPTTAAPAMARAP